MGGSICPNCNTGWTCKCNTTIAIDGKRVHSTCKNEYEEKIKEEKDDKKDQ